MLITASGHHGIDLNMKYSIPIRNTQHRSYQVSIVFLVDIVSFVEGQSLVDSKEWPVLLVAGPVQHHLYQNNYPLTVDPTSSLLTLVSRLHQVTSEIPDEQI